jgi:hypothetical protein
MVILLREQRAFTLEGPGEDTFGHSRRQLLSYVPNLSVVIVIPDDSLGHVGGAKTEDTLTGG